MSPLDSGAYNLSAENVLYFHNYSTPTVVMLPLVDKCRILGKYVSHRRVWLILSMFKLREITIFHT